MKYEVITFGSATLDLFVETESEKIIKQCEGNVCKQYLAYPSGDKALIREFHIDTGGGGTNVAACLNKLGISVAYGGCLSTDQQGKEILSSLNKLGVDFVGHTTTESSDLSVILDSKKLHDRTILNHKGASKKLSFRKLDKTKLQADWFYFSSLIEDSFESMIKLMRFASKNNIKIAFNPSLYQAKKGFKELSEVIELSKLLVLNKEEAQQLTEGVDIKSLCLGLRRKGCEIVLVTDGANGAGLLYENKYYYSKPRKVNVVETTGAGDCFASSFLAGLILNLNPEKSLRLAFLNAESLISKVGAKNGLLNKKTALSKLKSDKRPISIESINL